MTDDIRVREVQPGDVEAMARLLAESAESQGARDALCVDAAALLREGFGPSPRFRALVADAEGIVVGLAIYFFTFSTWTSINGIHLEDLYVERRYRRRGIARMLMRQLATVAADNGCRRFQWFVLRSNMEARRFYESLGAHVADEWAIMQLDARHTIEP